MCLCIQCVLSNRSARASRSHHEISNTPNGLFNGKFCEFYLKQVRHSEALAYILAPNLPNKHHLLLSKGEREKKKGR